MNVNNEKTSLVKLGHQLRGMTLRARRSEMGLILVKCLMIWQRIPPIIMFIGGLRPRWYLSCLVWLVKLNQRINHQSCWRFNSSLQRALSCLPYTIPTSSNKREKGIGETLGFPTNICPPSPRTPTSAHPSWAIRSSMGNFCFPMPMDWEKPRFKEGLLRDWMLSFDYQGSINVYI